MSEIDRSGLRPRFWERVPMDRMTRAEWEALCDGCGKCCLNKLEDEDSGEVALTRVACRLLDNDTCLCSQYPIRHQFVPECIVLTPKTIQDNMYWLPQTCAYRLLAKGEALYDWHPLISGDAEGPHAAGVTLRGQTVSEYEVADDDWEDHIIEEPT
ncbi:YcgN family cysteine cluster protein [Salipiger sp. IMCC34102]|uniref:YcgN family cysteine cluster protein n=1 Tax=Salipiger sp. IMCC34102 TaxID=2510647 RepID=UPI00101DD51E|nr:YcgN family cysteine cluster protein [Salipiger sp. IMCC34102]RYH03807.1 YcgN family cysteine cluster protein [Salipiger sp. IMCC34102]